VSLRRGNGAEIGRPEEGLITASARLVRAAEIAKRLAILCCYEGGSILRLSLMWFGRHQREFLTVSGYGCARYTEKKRLKDLKVSS